MLNSVRQQGAVGCFACVLGLSRQSAGAHNQHWPVRKKAQLVRHRFVKRINMLPALLAARHGQTALGSSILQAAAVMQLLEAFHSSSQCSGQKSSLLTPTNDDMIPKSTVSWDRLLTNSQLESLAIFRKFNISQPSLRGQVILAKVLRSTQKQVLVDPGYYGLNWVSKQELASATAYTADGQPIERTSAQLRPGDYVKLRLSYYNTPYGDAQLDPVGIPREVRNKLVWSELAHRMSKGKPVMGRILNATVKGYAVGVAGYVALLEHQHALPEVAAQIGTLQPFYIADMDSSRWQIKLSGISREVQHMPDMYRRSL